MAGNAIKQAIAKAEAIKSGAEAKGGWSDEDKQAFTAALGEIDKLKVVETESARLDELKKWAGEPDGQSAVKQGWRQAAPDEGAIEEVTQDHSRAMGANGAYELYATGKTGEAKLRTLKSGAYKDAFVDYLKATARGSAMKGEAMKVLQEGQDTAGGFWVPIDQRNELVKKMATTTGIRPNAFTFTTGSDMVSFPKSVYTTDDKYTSGTQLSWTAEAPSSDITESTNPAAGKVVIPVHTATASVIVTRAMLEDGQFDVLGYITSLLAEAFALGEEDVFINGTGSGQPQGFLSHANATVAHGSGGMYVLAGGSGTFIWGTGTTGILGLEAALPPQYDEKAKWYGTKTCFATIRSINATTAGIQWSLGDMYPNAANGYTSQLLGHPVVRSQFMPAVSSTTYPLAFGDMSGYYIADRVGLSIDVLREVRALRDEVVIYARKRVGGALVHDWKLKLGKSNSS